MNVTLDSIRDIRLYQSKTGYRFSVDALLLYNFINLRAVKTIADFGAGSGIVGLLLAKKYPEAEVTLLEIQESLIKLAEKNVMLNNLENRVRVVEYDLRKICNASCERSGYDLVVSNPPFRRFKSGLINIEEEKAIARHEITLKLHELIHAASFLLKVKGRFCMIYHPNRLSELIDALTKKDLEPKRLRFVHSNTLSGAKMVLIEAVRGGRTGLKVENPFFIYNMDGSYTEEMKEVYG